MLPASAGKATGKPYKRQKIQGKHEIEKHADCIVRGECEWAGDGGVCCLTPEKQEHDGEDDASAGECIGKKTHSRCECMESVIEDARSVPDEKAERGKEEKGGENQKHRRKILSDEVRSNSLLFCLITSICIIAQKCLLVNQRGVKTKLF